MSERMAYLEPSMMRPIAMPATGDLMGTPASISDKQPPHTAAIDDEPFDSSVSDTTRMVYGNLSFSGMSRRSARSARAPWPISRRPGPRMGLVSPVEKLGKL